MCFKMQNEYEKEKRMAVEYWKSQDREVEKKKLIDFQIWAADQLDVIRERLKGPWKLCLVAWMPGQTETEIVLIQEGRDLQEAIDVLERSKARAPGPAV